MTAMAALMQHGSVVFVHAAPGCTLQRKQNPHEGTLPRGKRTCSRGDFACYAVVDAGLIRRWDGDGAHLLDVIGGGMRSAMEEGSWR